MADDLPPHLPHPAGLTARFAALLALEPVPLAEVCTLLAAHLTVGADPDGTDLTAVRAGLDDLAKGVERPDLEGVVAHLVDLGLGGDATDYSSSVSSLLPDVVSRRRGLPILLAVVCVEVGRRVGADVRVVGMPGHVLVSDGGAPPRLADPFHRRASVTVADAEALFVRSHGDPKAWRPQHLAPIDGPAVVARILANLANRYRSDSRHREEAVVVGLRVMVPGVPVTERGALAAALARSGAFDRAAAELEVLADGGGAGMDPDALRGKADRWRARLN